MFSYVYAESTVFSITKSALIEFWYFDIILKLASFEFLYFGIQQITENNFSISVY